MSEQVFINIPNSGSPRWKSPVANPAALPAVGNTIGDVRLSLSNDTIYDWNGTNWVAIAGPGIDAAFGIIITPNGTYPHASIPTDSLTLTSSDNSITITGNSLTDTVNLQVAEISSPESANTVFAGPVSGPPAAPTFRDLVIADIPDLSSEYVTQSEVGQPNGVAPLGSGGKIALGYLPADVFIYEGVWDPATNTPTLVDGTGIAGYTYWVSTAYSPSVVGLNNPSMYNFQIGDLVIYNGTQWELTTPAAGVSFVNGMQGNVTVNAINQLTGDGTAGPATGSESEVLTLATVNSNPGTYSFATITVNGKGLVTAASSSTILNPPYTQGSVIFIGSNSLLAQDNPYFYWNDTSKSLGLGKIPTSTVTLDITAQSANSNTILNITDPSTGYMSFGNFNLHGGGNPTLLITSGASSGNYTNGTIQLTGNGNGGALYIQGSQNAGGYQAACITMDGYDHLCFQHVNDNLVGIVSTPFRMSVQSPNYALCIEYQGYVGVNTPNPSYPLDVNGTARTTNIIDTGLTASLPVFTNGSKELVSTGLVPVTMGGTGQSSSLVQYGVVYAANTTSMATTAAGTSGYVLTSNGSSAPTFQPVASSSYTFFDSLVASAGSVSLVNDTASPSANQYYGTNNSSTRGYYSLPNVPTQVSLLYFGDGSDGNVTISGSQTLTRDMFYNNLTINGSASLNPAGFRIFVAGTLDLTSAPAGAINSNGSTGNGSSNSVGATGGTGAATGSIGGSNIGGTGGAANPPTIAPTIAGVVAGGPGGHGGKGGNYGSPPVNTGAAAGTVTTTTFYTRRWDTALFYGTLPLTGGGSGGGGSGAANGSGGNPYAGAGGGSGGGIIWISANTINRSSGTAANAIQTNGGTGGTSGYAGGGGTGGPGGGGGGGGGWIYIAYGTLSGTTATNALEASGGAGGNGTQGNGGLPFGGAGGDGGSSGAGGIIELVNLMSNTVTLSSGPASVAGSSAGSGASGGAGAAFNTFQVSL
jgi:hypothetical protein